MKTIHNFIAGEFTESASSRTLSNYEPATGQIHSLLVDSDRHDVDNAVLAADEAFTEWHELTAETRAHHLLTIADNLQSRLHEFAAAESLDTGKPLSLATQVDIPRAVSNLRFFAHAATQFSSECHAMNQGINYTLRQAMGAVACISPWNLPLYLLTWKISPALAIGNTVVAKPSEITPLSAQMFAQLCQDSGLPPGVLNILNGSGSTSGQALIEHPKIKAVSFTGGTQTGSIIAQSLAPTFKKLSLELGGKNPTIIYADCDHETMYETVLRSSFSNQGQICLCGSRIFIERSFYREFVTQFSQRASQLIVGDPREPETQQGALSSEAHLEKVLRYIDLAKKEGGKLITGGYQVHPPGRCQHGWFVAPTIFEDLSASCRSYQEEIFGPVVTLTPFDTEIDLIEQVNNSRYGLAASIWSSNINRCHRLAKDIECGIVWINSWMLRDLRTPFGGMKDSGLGREGGTEALRFFTETKNVCVSYE